MQLGHQPVGLGGAEEDVHLGERLDSSSLWRSTMQPIAKTARQVPSSLRRVASRMASMDSCFAASMKPQVLTTTTSASRRS